MKRIYHLAGLLLCLSQGLTAQTLTIKVLDMVTHKPLEGAVIQGLEKSVTDPNGEATVALPDAAEKIYVSRSDYYSLFFQTSFSDFDASCEIQFFLVPVTSSPAVWMSTALRDAKATGYQEIEYEFTEDAHPGQSFTIKVYDEVNGFVHRISTATHSQDRFHILQPANADSTSDLPSSTPKAWVHLAHVVEEGQAFFVKQTLY